MKTVTANSLQTNNFLIRALTYLMFMMFAMTTDSVGVIIPVIIKTFHLSLTAASAFHYASMSGIAFAAIFLGFIADLLGRKATIIVGLALFAVGSYLFAAAHAFLWFVLLLFASGLAIGIFKTGALALIGDISQSTREHTSTMNMVEGFFGVGSIIGPTIVARLLVAKLSWKWLYVIAGTLCAVLLFIAALVKYPRTMKASAEPIDLRRTMHLLKNPFALGFSLALLLYVTVECAVYVWLPTYLIEHKPASSFMAAYVVAIFFLLRAAGRFLGAWVIARWKWTTVVMLFSGAVLACFFGGMLGGTDAAVYLLALSGLFMSVLYPTLNSKGISCFPKSEHGAVAGVLLFFTCGAAALGPLAMGAIGDLMGDLRYGFAFATVCAGLLFAGLLYNWICDPTQRALQQSDIADYNLSE